MSDLRDLYQQVIIDHSKKPRNFGALKDANRTRLGHNPLCGDKLVLEVKLVDDRVEEVKFQGTGCAISMASASMMTDAVKGKTKAEVEQLFESFHKLVTSDPLNPSVDESLGKLTVFSGVCEFPARVKCAALPWHTVKSAVEGEKEEDVVSTE